MNLKKIAIISFLAFLMLPFAAFGAISVTVPTPDGGAIHIGDKEWRRHHRQEERYEDRKICKEVTREKCKEKCRWSEFYGEERCQTYCRPVTEEHCWRSDRRY